MVRRPLGVVFENSEPSVGCADERRAGRRVEGMMSRLAGKVAIVTGSGAGQGAEEVRVLTALGAKVIATDLDAGAVQGVVASVNRQSPTASATRIR